LLEGQQATTNHFTNYDKGINGVFVDIKGAGGISADDFEFRTGNSEDPSSWTSVVTPESISVVFGGGANGSDRVKIVFADGAVKNTWLQVRVLANENTQLQQDDVFYFGNSVGETHDDFKVAVVDTNDRDRAIENATPVAEIGNRFDINRDGIVDDVDVAIIENNQTDSSSGPGIPVGRVGRSERP